MIKIIYVSFILTIIFSCSSNNSTNLEFEKEIRKRIEILNHSYKFGIIPINLQGKSFDKLKLHVDNILKANSKTDLSINYDSLTDLFANYKVGISSKPDSKDQLLFGILIGLDDLIFKYVPSRLNFSDYKTIVIPNNGTIQSGDTLRAKIYLTVSDSLYEPEFKVFDLNSLGEIKHEYNLVCENGIGEYNMLTNTKGIKKIKGIVIYSNEFGSKDTLDWNYKIEVK